MTSRDEIVARLATLGQCDSRSYRAIIDDLLAQADALAAALEDYIEFDMGDDLSQPQCDSWVRAQAALAAYRGAP